MSQLTFTQYQSRAIKAATPRDQKEDLTIGALGLSNAIGRVSRMVRSHMMHGRLISRDAMLDEIGALLWYSALITKTVGSTLEDAAIKNLGEINDVKKCRKF